MKIISLETANKKLDNADLAHLFLCVWVIANIQQDIDTHKEKFILLPNEHIKLLELRLSSDSIFLLILPPGLNILTVHQVKTLYLVFDDIYHSLANHILGNYLLELNIVG